MKELCCDDYSMKGIGVQCVKIFVLGWLHPERKFIGSKIRFVTT